MIPSLSEFSSAIEKANLGMTEEQINRASLFAHILHRENEVQNLTRILGVGEFIDGHLVDVLELLKLPTLGLEVMDIGSGCGVPGLLAAAIDTNPDRLWQLVESEVNKANYLRDSASEMDLENVIVVHGRAEEALKELEPDTVVARAVGTVEKISAWIWNCSTWNNLVLYKSKGWDEEWKSAQLTRFGKKLTVTHAHDYSTEDKYRILVTLSRAKFG
jgi:16S rRNA (guanine(527)-N(7))-methyltransferase RsmG